MPRHHTLVSLIAALAVTTAGVRAQEAAWQSSYQLEATGKYADALAAVDTLSANGAEAELRTLRRGWLLYLSGRLDESIREYRLAVERNSKSIDARLGLTLPLLAAKRWREAEQASRAALELAPNQYTALTRLALAQEGQREWSGMARTAAAMVAHYNSDAGAFVYLARAYAWLNRRDDASAAYHAVLTRYPGHPEAKAWLDPK